ncbi:DUF5819 family protein [Mycetocola zhadangensis]|uniref:Uncharacterized protein n=1 Tax=Mycetocola zhadangensis TaxID=1164595 RepID=A0A3L7J0Z0_9MICO|nr:DUF5819 family protein [Mycetocola zhadangensis]RLQ84127.1 hypothetical protein D9V28_07795 [Mycetocola zhadangensis]GGE95944.1 hypothetical protein GCM10011313_18610 [Mycetocola zhadangensis]
MSSRAKGPRIAAIVALLAVAAYVAVTLIIVLPSSPMRPAVVSAASPYFSQKWNVFAPNIMKTNSELVIQAQWRDDGQLVKSDWVSITAIEQNSVAGSAMPSRIQKSSWNAVNAYNKRYVALTEAQRNVVRDTFIERHDGGYRAKQAEPLVSQLTEMGQNRAAVVQFLRYDYMLKESATTFATAHFDKPIERVRWKLQRERPNDFEHRFDDEAQFDPYVVVFGWRHADDLIDPETIAVYDDVLARYGDSR